MNNKEKSNAPGALEDLYDEDDYKKLKCTICKKLYFENWKIFKLRKDRKK